jgi:amino acid permease
MEFAVWSKNRKTIGKIAHYAIVALLVGFMFLFTTKFKSINQYLLSVNGNGLFLPIVWWSILAKFIMYCVHIMLNFSILYAFTRNLRFSLVMVYVAIAILSIGMLLVAFRDFLGVNIPLPLVTFFVKLDKTPILLVLFVAAHIVKKKELI